MGYQCISSAMSSSALLDYQTQLKQSSCKHLCICRPWHTELIHIDTQAIPYFRKPKQWIWLSENYFNHENLSQPEQYSWKWKFPWLWATFLCPKSWATQRTKQALLPGVTTFFPVETLTLNTTQWLWHLPEQCDGHCKWPPRKSPCSFAWTLSHERIIKTFVMLQQITQTLLDLKVSFSLFSLPSFLKNHWIHPLIRWCDSFSTLKNCLWTTKTIP